MEGDIPIAPNGVLVSMVAGKVVAFGLDTLARAGRAVRRARATKSTKA